MDAQIAAQLLNVQYAIMMFIWVLWTEHAYVAMDIFLTPMALALLVALHMEIVENAIHFTALGVA